MAYPFTCPATWKYWKLGIRVRKWKGRDEKIYLSAMERAFELFDFTIADKRRENRFKEILRAREVLADAFLGGKEYKIELKGLEPYFDHFAIAPRNR